MSGRRAVLSMCAVVALAVPAAAQVDQQRAAIYFEEAAAICAHDGGRLWGRSLCGPMVFGDLRTRTIATSQPPPAAERPTSIGLVNAPLEWDGERWAAYIWDFITPLDDRRRRGEFMLHELFHRIQPQLGLVTGNGQNEHLDTVDGRYWLQLEWRALAQALRLSRDQGSRALRDALAFRRTRRALFPDSAENERLDEIREGLAQYTGTVLSSTSEAEAAASAVDQLAAAEKQETFVQMFAYPSGAAYGVLLDTWSPGWTRRVQATSDLGQLLTTAAGIEPAENAGAAAAQYGGTELRVAEETRDQQRKTLVRELRARFVDGPVLLLPGSGGGTFDARGATPIPGSGTVYFASYRVKGEWGSLEATNGVLVSADHVTRRVPAPARIDGAVLAGDGWTVTLAPGWIARSGPRPSDYQIVRDAR